MGALRTRFNWAILSKFDSFYHFSFFHSNFVGQMRFKAYLDRFVVQGIRVEALLSIHISKSPILQVENPDHNLFLFFYLVGQVQS